MHHFSFPEPEPHIDPVGRIEEIFHGNGGLGSGLQK
jgi:hypothetical protein